MQKDEEGNKRYYGIYAGEVTAVKDPLKKNRLKFKVPQVLGDEPTDWSYGAESRLGSPKIGQGVYVMFLGGDPSHPIWFGTFGKKGKGTGAAGKSGLMQSWEGSTAGFVMEASPDGTMSVDIIATLASFNERIAQLEADMPTALMNGLQFRA